MRLVTHDNMLLEKADIDNLQEYLGDSSGFIQYIFSELFAYENCFTGDNLKVIQTTPASMNVEITAGRGIVDYKLGELDANEVIAITAGGVSERIDIITCAVTMTDDAVEAKAFIDPATETPTTDSVVMKKAYRFTFYYHEGTEVVPAGQVLIATITVPALATTVVTADIADERPAKPGTDLPAHAASNPIDHAAGSIGDVAISTTADIATTKINGISVDTLETLIGMGLPLNFSQTLTYDGDGNITEISQTGDHSWVMTISYDVDGNVDEVEVEDAGFVYTITITWTGDSVTAISGVVVAK